MAARPMPLWVLVTVVAACVVTVAAMLTAVLLRPGPPAPAGKGAHDRSGCGTDPCRVLVSTEVNGMPVELLADREGRAGRLRAGGPASGTTVGIAITTMGARLNQNSLRCAQTATPVCLVRGFRPGGMAGEVHIWRGDRWFPAGRPYLSDVGSIVLDDITSDGVPEIIVVRHRCGDGNAGAATCRDNPVLAEVTDLTGKRVGCTRDHASPGDLRGWPEVQVSSDELVTCP